MWHLKTKLGVFWVVEHASDLGDKKYYLGLGDHELGLYDDANQAAMDVSNQATGDFSWDCQANVSVPRDIRSWSAGEPENWH